MTALRWIYLFIRFPALSYTALLPLLGAGSVSPGIGARHVWALLAVAVMFHTFAYVSNDVIDLPIDRTDRWRADHPLVRHSIAPGAALAVALEQVPAAFLVTWAMRWSVEAHGALLVALVLMAAYNLWGKRCAVPPVIDVVQGVAWAALVLYGAFTAGRPSAATALLAVHTFLFTLMINGVHGGLRDLANDWRWRARTTAIFLGARPHPVSGVVLPRAVIAYVGCLQASLVAITLARLLHAWTGEGDDLGTVAPILTVALTALSLILPAAALRRQQDGPSLGLVGTLHLVLSQAVLAALYGLPLGGTLVIAVILVFTVPILAMWAHNGSRWG